MRRWWFMPVAALFFAACDQETPTEIGAGLLPPGAVRTFEVTLEAHRYLVFDTAFGQYTNPAAAPFVVVAREFEGLNSNAVVRFSMPTVVTVSDTAGVFRVDSFPTFFSGTVRMQLDTTRVLPEDVQLALYRTAEDWDGSATWTLRTDTPGVRLPWTTPGGTAGELVSRITLPAGADSIAFPVDSATLAHWADLSDPTRGALIVVETPGVRMRTSLPALFIEARPSIRPDTVVTTVAAGAVRTYLLDPEQPTVWHAPRVGGTPSWRTMLRLRDRLDTVTVACPGVPNCVVRLGEADITHAALRLQPTVVESGYWPDQALTLGAFLLLPSPQVPLARSPLGELAGIVTVQPSSFTAPGAPVVEVTLTDLIRLAALHPEERGDRIVPTHFALAPGEPRTFGFAAFEPMPPLRLVLSIARELQLP